MGSFDSAYEAKIASIAQEFEGYEPPRYYSPVDPEPTPKATWFSLFRPKGTSLTPPHSLEVSNPPAEQVKEIDNGRRPRRASESAVTDVSKSSPSFFQKLGLARKFNSFAYD